MMRFLFTIFILLIGVSVKAQINNLVPNPSFEEYDTCPNDQAQIFFASPWFQATSGTCDYFNTCCIIPSITGGVGVPDNAMGFQYARTGSCYSGLILMGFSGLPYREYIETRLIQPLDSGQTYCVEFYVSLTQHSTVTTDLIGVYFTEDSLVSNTLSAIFCTNQIQNPAGNYLSDTVNWMKVSGHFVANGGENFITIGNFNNLSIDDFAYYYLDDVSVYLCSDTLEKPELKIPNVFTPDNDGVNDVFEIENLPQGAEATIYNRWGALLFESSNPNTFWDGRTKGGTPVPGGIYYYVVKIPGSESKKGFVEVIR